MVGFCKKEIKNSVGDILCYLRRKKGLKLEGVAEEIMIEKKYLAALEKNAIDKLPGKVYALNFLKKYSSFLDLDEDAMKNKFEADFCWFYKKCKKTKKSFWRKISITPKVLKFAGFSLVLVALLSYLGMFIYKTIAPPEIVLENLQPEAVVKKQKIKINGQADNDAEVSVNGQKVSLLEDGEFEHDVYLTKGINEIEVKAKKKYSRENSKIYKIMYLTN